MYNEQKGTCVGVLESNKPVITTEVSDSSKKSIHGAMAVVKKTILHGLGPHFPSLKIVGSKQPLTVKYQLQEKILLCLTKLNASIWFVNHNANLG